MSRTPAEPCGCQNCASRPDPLPTRGALTVGRPRTAPLPSAGEPGTRADGLLTISEVARAAGVSASALRFYESEGLVVPVTRTSAGYRLYAAAQVERVRFLRRAQRLGLTLAQVGDLLACADSDHPLPAREQLRDLVGNKIDRVRQQVGELQELAGRLENVHRRLGGPPDGGCTRLTACGCLTVDAPTVN